jgi:hypothetical protein
LAELVVPDRIDVGFFEARDLKVPLQNDLFGGFCVAGPLLIESHRFQNVSSLLLVEHWDFHLAAPTI